MFYCLQRVSTVKTAVERNRCSQKLLTVSVTSQKVGVSVGPWPLFLSASEAGRAREVKGMGRSQAAEFGKKNQTFWKPTSCWGGRPTFLHHFLLQTSGNDQRRSVGEREGESEREGSHLHYIAGPPTQPQPPPCHPQQNRSLEHGAVCHARRHSVPNITAL